MDVLDSHLEALAFNYVRFGFFTLVNNLWTWVAVITAAVSFWRLRVSGFLKSDHLNADVSHSALDLTPSSDSAVEPQPPPPSKPTTTSTSAASSEAVVSSVCDCDVRGARVVTKGRFTAYYGEERESRLLTTVAAVEWDNNDGGFDVFGGGVVGEELKKVVRVRMGDMGLYRFQDLTAINGNVVKLWDDCRMRRSSSNRLECVNCVVVLV